MNHLADFHKVIADLDVLTGLDKYDATVVSTLQLDFNAPGSDIDIVCCYANQNEFAEQLTVRYEVQDGFELKQHSDFCLCNFRFRNFQFEIYGAPIPVQEQNAYRHFHIMKRLRELGGEAFAYQVRALRAQGLKPEAAICTLLRIEGEPYSAILTLEHESDMQLITLLSSL